MKISIVDRQGQLSEDALKLAHRRLLFALSRFDSRIEQVELTVSDLNGPKGGIDIECRVRVRMQRGEDVVVTDRDASLGPCISRAADRVARTLARRVQRFQNAHRRRRLAVGDRF